MTNETLIVLGRLARPHGIKGEIRVEYNAESPDLLDFPLFLRAGNTPPVPVQIESFRYWKEQLILRLEGIHDRSAAEELRGRELLIRESDFPEAEDDEPYLRDIIGLTVVLDESGEILGVLEDVIFPAGQEVWSIRATLPAHDLPNALPDALPDALPTSDEHMAPKTDYEILLPAVPEFVTDIDLSAETIRIAPPPGLLDIYRPSPDTPTITKKKRPIPRKKRSHTPEH